MENPHVESKTLEHLIRFIARCGSNKEAAKRLKISPQQISNYLKGRRIPGAKLREKLRRAGCVVEDEAPVGENAYTIHHTLPIQEIPKSVHEIIAELEAKVHFQEGVIQTLRAQLSECENPEKKPWVIHFANGSFISSGKPEEIQTPVPEAKP